MRNHILKPAISKSIFRQKKKRCVYLADQRSSVHTFAGIRSRNKVWLSCHAVPEYMHLTVPLAYSLYSLVDSFWYSQVLHPSEQFVNKHAWNQHEEQASPES